jgi:hypothetical protein
MPSIWRKSGGSWVKLKTVYRKTGGSWQSVKRVWRKSGGTWRLVFLQSLTPSIAQAVSISTSLTATQTRTLIGTLYRWSDSTSVTYQFTKSTNDISYTNISGASGTSTNPTTSNTLDRYTLLQADVTPNTTNYYKYISKGINSTFSTEQTSPSGYTFVEAPRNLTLTGTKTSTSATVTWTNDTYSGRYEYQYKLTSSETYGSSIYVVPGSTQTSFTVTSLTNSTSYDFQVRGWTGTVSGYGYYGNWATVTVVTNAPAAPNPPTSVQAASGTIDTDSFFLEWTASTTDSTHDAATSYDFGINSSAGSPPTTLITTGNPGVGQYRNKLLADTNLYELISSLSSNTNYYAYVRAKNSGGSSAWAASSVIKTVALRPPNDVTALSKDTTIDSETSLKFKWTAPVADTTHLDATSYIYRLSTTDAAPTAAEEFETVDSTANLTISNLTGGTTYYFYIKAKNAEGRSPNFVRATGTTKATSNPPGVPSAVSLGNPSQSGLRFTWAAPTTGGTVVSYLIALSISTAEPTTENLYSYDGYYYDTTTTTTNFTFGVLDPNKTYYAWVKARNADGTSTSVRRNATTAAAPTVGAPTWTAGTNFQRVTSGTANFRWGWGNTGTLSPTTGTYTAMTRNGMYWEFYTSVSGTTPSNSGYKSQSTTNDARIAVNGTNFPYLLWSGGSSPDITYSANARYVRVQADAYDYEGKGWQSSWTARI